MAYLVIIALVLAFVGMQRLNQLQRKVQELKEAINELQTQQDPQRDLPVLTEELQIPTGR